MIFWGRCVGLSFWLSDGVWWVLLWVCSCIVVLILLCIWRSLVCICLLLGFGIICRGIRMVW